MLQCCRRARNRHNIHIISRKVKGQPTKFALNTATYAWQILAPIHTTQRLPAHAPDEQNIDIAIGNSSLMQYVTLSYAHIYTCLLPHRTCGKWVSRFTDFTHGNLQSRWTTRREWNCETQPMTLGDTKISVQVLSYRWSCMHNVVQVYE